jgi:hypothetical protein
MSKAVIFDQIKTRLGFFKNKDLANTRFQDSNHSSVMIGENEKLHSIFSTDYPLSDLIDSNFVAIPASVLPFRVKFTTIGIESYGPNNPAPIGIAVIGFNNYIL